MWKRAVLLGLLWMALLAPAPASAVDLSGYSVKLVGQSDTRLRNGGRSVVGWTLYVYFARDGRSFVYSGPEVGLLFQPGQKNGQYSPSGEEVHNVRLEVGNDKISVRYEMDRLDSPLQIATFSSSISSLAKCRLTGFKYQVKPNHGLDFVKSTTAKPVSCSIEAGPPPKVWN